MSAREAIGGCAVTEEGRLFCFSIDRHEGCEELTQVAGIDDAVEVTITMVEVTITMEEICVLHRTGGVTCASIGFQQTIGEFEAQGSPLARRITF